MAIWGNSGRRAMCPRPELGVVIRPPTPDSGVGIDRTCVKVARRDLLDAAQIGDLDRDVASHVRRDSELTAVVGAPAPNGASGANRARVVFACGDLNGIRDHVGWTSRVGTGIRRVGAGVPSQRRSNPSRACSSPDYRRP